LASYGENGWSSTRVTNYKGMLFITHPESVKFLSAHRDLSSSDINSVETQEDPKERGISLMKKKNPNYTLSCFVPTCSSILKC